MTTRSTCTGSKQYIAAYAYLLFCGTERQIAATPNYAHCNFREQWT